MSNESRAPIPRKQTMSRPNQDDARREPLVVAIDGPSGSGKSSVARAVAQRLGLRYLDTGAMYRAVTWWMLQNHISLQDADAIAAKAGEPHLVVGFDPATASVSVDGVDVGTAIRTPEVTAAVSAVSAVPAVRARLVAVQREAISAGGIVVEGRDIGTVVAPEATLKVFLTASDEARASRRASELPSHGDVATVLASVATRDRLDSSRTISPLRKADDAIEVDATDLSLEQVIDRVLALLHERRAPSDDIETARRPAGTSDEAPTTRAVP